MKKMITFFLVLLILFVNTVLVCAASNTYKLSEMELEVTVPSNYSVITRKTSASNPIFDKLETTYSDLMSHFVSNNIYLTAVSNDLNEEIVVTMAPNEINDFNLLSDTTLRTLMDTIVDDLKDYGMSVSKFETYKHSQAKFVKIYFTNTITSTYGLQYYTVYNSKAINFTIHSYDGPISSMQESAIKTVVDSIKFNSAPIKTEKAEETNSFVYKDLDSATSFTVPKNWQQKDFTADRKFLDAKFVSNKDEALSILYGSTDIWNEMSDFEKSNYSRGECDNSLFTKQEISQIFGTTEDEISTVTYNGNEYFCATVKNDSNTYGINITMTELICFKNGWMYSFQFGGTSESEYFADFESLLNSVQYSLSTNYSNIDKTDNNIWAMVVFLLFVIIAIVAIIVFMKRNIKNPENENLESMQCNIEAFQNLHHETKENSCKTCKNCGQEIPADSEFCHICGMKINVEGKE